MALADATSTSSSRLRAAIVARRSELMLLLLLGGGALCAWLADGLYPQLWWPHVRDARCLLGLPGVPLNVTR